MNEHIDMLRQLKQECIGIQGQRGAEALDWALSLLDPESATVTNQLDAALANVAELRAERDELKKRVEWLEKANRSFSDVVLDM